MDNLRGFSESQEGERVCPLLLERGLRDRGRGSEPRSTMARRETLPVYLGGEGGTIMFEVSLRWQDGLIQCLVYAVVIVIPLIIMSKIEKRKGRK
jgi:hypothetical protein